MNKFFLSLFAAAALAACAAPKAPHSAAELPAEAAALSQHASQLTARIVRPENTVIAYYDADGNEQSEPQTGGYYRRLLGYTSEKYAVVQDFYQDSNLKQIDPTIIKNLKQITSFNPEDSEGLTVWYSRKGEIHQAAYFHNGKPLRSAHYHNGRLLMRAEFKPSASGKEFATLTGYYDNGRPMFAIVTAEDGSSLGRFFHDNGQILFEALKEAGSEGRYWNAEGEEVDREAVLDQILTTDKRMQNILHLLQQNRE